MVVFLDLLFTCVPFHGSVVEILFIVKEVLGDDCDFLILIPAIVVK